MSIKTPEARIVYNEKNRNFLFDRFAMCYLIDSRIAVFAILQPTAFRRDEYENVQTKKKNQTKQAEQTIEIKPIEKK